LFQLTSSRVRHAQFLRFLVLRMPPPPRTGGAPVTNIRTTSSLPKGSSLLMIGLTSGFVQVFGCRVGGTIHALQWPAWAAHAYRSTDAARAAGLRLCHSRLPGSVRARFSCGRAKQYRCADEGLSLYKPLWKTLPPEVSQRYEWGTMRGCLMPLA